MDTSHFDTMMIKLKALKAELALHKSHYELELKEFNELHSEDLELISNLKEQIFSLDMLIREKALDHYSYEKNKTITPDIKVKETIKYSFTQEEAIEWCVKRGMVECLKVDERLFRKLLSGLYNKPQFVTVRQVPVVYLSRADSNEDDN